MVKTWCTPPASRFWSCGCQRLSPGGWPNLWRCQSRWASHCLARVTTRLPNVENLLECWNVRFLAIGMGLEWDWNVGMGLMSRMYWNWTSSVSTRIYRQKFDMCNMWISAPRGPMSTFSALKMTRTVNGIETFYSWKILRQSSLSEIRTSNHDEQFEHREDIESQCFDCFELPVSVTVSYCVTVSALFSIRVNQKIWDSFPVPSGHQMAVDAIQLLATSMIWAK